MHLFNSYLVSDEPLSYTLFVQPSNNYPMDLYLLMDLSFSMKDDLSNLKVLGSHLGVQNLTMYNYYTRIATNSMAK